MSRPAVVGLVALLAFIWGSTWLAIRIGLDAVPPFLGAAARFAGAAVLLFGLARARGVRLPQSRRAHVGLLGLGFGSVGVSYGVVYWSEQYIPSGLAAVLFAMHPLFVLLLAHWVLPDERMTAGRGLGVLLGVVGVGLIFQADLRFPHPLAPLAAAVVLVSPLTAAISGVVVKRWAHHVHPYNLAMLPMAYGAGGLLLVSAVTEEWGTARWTGPAIGSVVYLSVFGSVIAFVVYYTLLKQLPVNTLALLSFVYPVVAVFLGWLVRGEALGSQALAGAACIAVGIVIATTRRRRPLALDPTR
ncbi:MAG: DMT family transporter [Gemmatimonadota bacterium]